MAFDINVTEAAKALADEAASKLVPPITDALAELPAALVDALDGLTITVSITRKAKS